MPAEYEVFCYPNKGEEWNAVHREWHPTDDSVAVDTNVGVLAQQWVSAGATVLGGCCRVCPAEIAAMKAAVSVGELLAPAAAAAAAAAV